MTAQKRIGVYGGVMIDRLATAHGSFVAGASNPGHAVRRVGGVSLNVATILAGLGDRVRLVGRVGDDDDGRAALAAATAAGIVARGIGVSPARPTGTYTAVFDREGGLVAGVADMDLYDELTPEAIGAVDLPGPHDDVVVVDANVPEATIAHLADRAAAAGRPFAGLTVSPVKARRFASCLPWIGYLFANRAEAASILGLDERDGARAPAADLAAGIAALGAKAVVVTSGGDPLAFAAAGEVRTIRPPPIPVEVNVNGAGDSLAAGTIHALAAGAPLATAIRSGLAAAALTLEHGGIAEAMFSADRLATMTKVVETRLANDEDDA